MKCGYSRESDQQMLIKELTEQLTEGKRLEKRKREGPGLHTAIDTRSQPSSTNKSALNPQGRPHFRDEKSEAQRS